MASQYTIRQNLIYLQNQQALGKIIDVAWDYSVHISCELRCELSALLESQVSSSSSKADITVVFRPFEKEGEFSVLSVYPLGPPAPDQEQLRLAAEASAYKIALLRILCSKVTGFKLPVAQPSYVVSDGDTASVYSLFKGKLWELPITGDLLRREQVHCGAIMWMPDKFIDEVIALMKHGKIEFKDDGVVYSWTYDSDLHPFDSLRHALSPVEGSLPPKFSLALSLVETASVASPVVAAASPAVVAASPAVAAGSPAVRRRGKKRKSQQQKTKSYVKIMRKGNKLRF